MDTTKRQRIEDMWGMYRRGDTVEAIAIHYGISKQRVAKILTDAGYELRVGKPPRIHRQAIIDFIQDYYGRTGIPPTLGEISVAVYGHEDGASNILRMVNQLIADGYLYKAVANSPRTLMLTKPQPQTGKRGDK